MINTTETTTAQFNYEFEEGLREAAHREAQKLQDEGFTGIATLLISHEQGVPDEPLIQLQPGTGITAHHHEFYQEHPGAGEELYEYLTGLAYPPGYNYAYAVELTGNNEGGQHHAVIY